MENKVLYCNGLQLNMAKDNKTLVMHFFATVPGPKSDGEDVKVSDILQASIALDEEGISNLIIGMSGIVDSLKSIHDKMLNENAGI